MTDLLKLLGEIKSQLKTSMTPELTKEQVDDFVKIDKKLDEVEEAYKDLSKKYDDLKDAYINQAKNTGFKSNGSKDEDDSGETKSFDDILEEELEKTLEKEKKLNG